MPERDIREELEKMQLLNSKNNLNEAHDDDDIPVGSLRWWTEDMETTLMTLVVMAHIIFIVIFIIELYGLSMSW